MNKSDVIVGLDIGNTKVSALVCEVGASDNLEVIGIGTSPSVGLRKGVITDIEAACDCICEAISRAENMSGCSIGSVTVGMAGTQIVSMNSRGVIAVARPDREITNDDVERVLEAAKVIAIPPDREIIHVLPKEFIIDGCRGIRRPVGMCGIRLEVETHIITGSATSIQNVKKSVLNSDLDIEQTILQPLASSEAVLTIEEKEQGVLMVDIGGGTTDVSIFSEGSILHTAIIPIGGALITNDIALVMRIPIPIAEELKIADGCAITSMVPEGQMCGAVPSDPSGMYTNVNRQEMCSVIEARVLEIISHIKGEMEKAGIEGHLPAGVVITGGTALLPGIAQIIQDEMDMPVRLGIPYGVYGMSNIISSPEFSTVVGLVKLAWADVRSASRGGGGTQRQPRAKSERKPSIFAGIKDIFKDMFSP